MKGWREMRHLTEEVNSHKVENDLVEKKQLDLIDQVGSIMKETHGVDAQIKEVK